MPDFTIELTETSEGWEAVHISPRAGRLAKGTGSTRLGAMHNLLDTIHHLAGISDEYREEVKPCQQFVVPKYVVACIEQFVHEDGYVRPVSGGPTPGYALSRFLTKTLSESGDGIFSYCDSESFVWGRDKTVRVKLDDVPIYDEKTFRENLIERCRRVGQAIMDEEAKLKKVDPDEGLPVITKGLFDGLHVSLYGFVLGANDEEWGMFASRRFTGTFCENGQGVFDRPGGLSEFTVKVNEDKAINFTVEFPCDLASENLIAEIPNRIRLVREARAKALQEAGK